MPIRLLLRRALPCLVVAAAASAATPALASAADPTLSITPCSSCTPSSTTFPAGGSPSLTIAGTVGSNAAGSPSLITIQTAPGVLANASAAPSCLTGAPQHTSACEIGTGAVDAGVSAPFTAYLVPATTAGDIAGADLVLASPSVTAHAELSVQQLTSGPGAGQVVVTFKADLSSLGPLASLITGLTLNLNGTLNGQPLTRMPTACTPVAPSAVAVTYGSGAGAATLTAVASPDVAPPTLTGCSSLAYSPTFTATATKDAGDSGVALTTKIDQASGQAATKSLTLSVPTTVLTPNTALLAVECAAADPATCPASSDVGTVSATSPLLPGTFTGKVVVTKGSGLLPNLSIVITNPAKIVLTGTIAVTASGAVATTFGTIPDLPLSDLTVSLAGGSTAAFQAPCTATSGAIGGAFTAQNGKTATLSAPVTISGCSGGGGGGTAKAPTLSGGSLSGILKGKPKLSFKLTAGKNAPKLSSFVVSLPKGLSFISKGLKTGLKIKGAKIKSAKIKHGKLTVKLKAPAGSASVSLTAKALKASKALIKGVTDHKVKSLKLTVKVTDTSGKSNTLSHVFTSLS